MYKLFEAAHAMTFAAGCHAKWSNFELKSEAPPFISPLGLSFPGQSTTVETKT